MMIELFKDSAGASPSPEKHSRREFLRSSGRYLILGGLALATGSLIAKRILAFLDTRCSILDARYPESSIQRPVSSIQNICQGCMSFKKCGLPPALSVRESLVNSQWSLADGH